MAAVGRVRMRRPGTPGPRGGGVYVTELQRTRLLDATFAVVSEDGYRRMTARRVSGRAGVSNKTFYDLFSDREDCFLAAFDRAVAELAAVVRPAYESKRHWSEKVRAGLSALLELIGDEPGLGALVIVDALGAGPRVLQRRAQWLEALGSIVDQGRDVVKPGSERPPLTPESIVGAVLSVLHGRLLERDGPPLVELLNPLMATIVLPYLGPRRLPEKSLRIRCPEPGRASCSPARRGWRGCQAVEWPVTVRGLPSDPAYADGSHLRRGAPGRE